jgi:hypothetical protein
MTTLCLCDWVETKEERELRLPMRRPEKAAPGSNVPHCIPVILDWPALLEWPSIPLWPDALAWTCTFETRDRENP